ncbi:putative replication factor c protein [Neofusicoccum parvum UCRNP2]|uniref:Putative replication factor c protein n=1 Tax=Botryosphaeria parva (strain UCR-NP2) TaxID=1287680 RepID=R1E7I1_BOTPV|nr:putative replication factor c protein [Neofusicoccum parvum UCRNP2]
MAPTSIFIVKREDPEGAVSILSAHATKKSAVDAAKLENDTADVEEIELVGDTVTVSKKSPTPAANTKAKKTAAPSKKKEASGDLPTPDPAALTDETIIFTGELSRMTRSEAQNLAKAAGARTVTAVSKNCTLVVLGQRAGPKKIAEIEKLGLATVDEDEFLNMVKGDGDGAVAGTKRAAGDDDDDMDDEEEEGEEEEEEEEKPAPKKRARKAKA